MSIYFTKALFHILLFVCFLAGGGGGGGGRKSNFKWYTPL